MTFLLAMEEVKNFLPRVLAYCSTHGAFGSASAKLEDSARQRRILSSDGTMMMSVL
jgi:hypothetical protein